MPRQPERHTTRSTRRLSPPYIRTVTSTNTRSPLHISVYTSCDRRQVKAGAYEGLNDVFLVGFTEKEVNTLSRLVDELVVDANCERATEEMLDSFGATVRPPLPGLHAK